MLRQDVYPTRWAIVPTLNGHYFLSQLTYGCERGEEIHSTIGSRSE